MKADTALFVLNSKVIGLTNISATIIGKLLLSFSGVERALEKN
jgi:hypothetical protein